MVTIHFCVFTDCRMAVLEDTSLDTMYISSKIDLKLLSSSGIGHLKLMYPPCILSMDKQLCIFAKQSVNAFYKFLPLVSYAFFSFLPYWFSTDRPTVHGKSKGHDLDWCYRCFLEKGKWSKYRIKRSKVRNPRQKNL